MQFAASESAAEAMARLGPDQVAWGAALQTMVLRKGVSADMEFSADESVRQADPANTDESSMADTWPW